ncbi:MAG: tRNA pseudouridine(38-40) synthase TruA [Nitrospiria bacterium]
MSNISLVIEYVGTRYHGWQRQPKLPTIQGALEECIKRISGEKVTLLGAGRTDSGVHALGQVANFKTSSNLKAQSWRNALNALLPKDIVILEAQEVPKPFHARRAARSKTYQYRILNRRTPSAILRPLSWHIPIPLRLRPMQVAARKLVGFHDFTSFCGKSSERRSTTAQLFRLSVERRKDLTLITISGTHFLQYMARNIVGTLVQVGMGKLSPQQITTILEARDRGRAGPTAPPQGLFLVKVKY